MKANELRIGNFVQDKKWKTPWIINCFLGLSTVEVDSASVSFPTDSCHEPSLHTLEPIPLTEEWLERFGFEKVSEDYVRYDLKASKDIYIIYADDYSCALFNSKESEEDELGVIPNWETIKHVHQLQNLYFALTGQELTIKEPKKCKYVKREGESCTLNDNCTYPNCKE